MADRIHLVVPFETFKSNADKAISEAALLHQTAVDSQEQYDVIKTKTEEWEKNTLQMLGCSFNLEENKFKNEFQYAAPLYFANPDLKFSELTERLKNRIAERQKSLWGNLRILSVCDAIIKPEQIDIAHRESYSIDETLGLILEKLYELYDDFYYPIGEILEGNGIKMRRHDDDRNLANMLKDRGLILAMGTSDGINAQLTGEGAMFVERNRKATKENYNDINKSQQEMNEKIDEIMQRLEKLGFGQEIIYDELQELKDLYSKIDKKTWGQLLKGKLIDLSVEKILDMDTLMFIYKSLTTHQLILP